MTKRQIFGLVASIVLLVGAFLPIIRIPFVGDVSYFDLENGNGKLVALYAIAGIVLSALRQERWLLIPAGIALLQVGYAFYDLSKQLDAGSNNIFTNWIQQAGLYDPGSLLGPGWIAMLLGAVLLGLTPFLPLDGGTTHKMPKTKSSSDGGDFI